MTAAAIAGALAATIWGIRGSGPEIGGAERIRGEESDDAAGASHDPVFGGSSDEILYAIAEVHPRFAGFWLDESEGTMTVLFKGEVDQATAEEVVRLFVVASDDRRFLEGRVVPRGDADYSFKELFEWYQPLQVAIGGVEGWVISDIDERANRIKFGVQNVPEDVEDQIETMLRQHAVPREAVIIEEWGPIVPDPA